jgi:hypothetical protein
MSHKKTYADKAVQGKVHTSSNLTVEQEPLRRGAILQKAESVGTFVNPTGDVRVIGDIKTEALLAQNPVNTHPTYHPSRHRKLTQQINFFGGDVIAEGTAGNIVSATELDTEGVVVNHVGEGDLLWITHPKSDESLGTYRVLESSGTVMTIQGEFPAQNDNYHFVVYRPNPVQLLPYPSEADKGKETTYLTVLPKLWPVWEHPFSDKRDGVVLSPLKETHTHQGFANIVRRANDQLEVYLDNATTVPFFEEGDFIILGEDFGPFLVSVIDLDTGQSEEILTLTPCHNTNVNLLSSDKVGTTVSKLYSCQEVIENNALLNENLIQAIRVKNLIAPQDLTGSWEDASNEYIANLNSSTSTTDSLRQHASRSTYNVLKPAKAKDLGFRMVLFPAKADGTPDLTRPVFPDRPLVLDPSVEEEQDILVDYAEGVVSFSHPLAEDGDLNPNHFLDDEDQVRVFATFVALNGAVSPVSSQEVSVRLSGKESPIHTSISYKSEGLDPVEKDAWVVDLTEGSIQEDYFDHPEFIQGGGKKRKIAFSSGDEGRVEQRVQFRDEERGSTHLSTIGFGKILNTDDPNQIFFVPDAGNQYRKGEGNTLEYQELPDVKVSSEKRHISFQVSDPVEIDGTNNTLNLVINETEVSLVLDDGFYSLGQFLSTIPAKLSNDYGLILGQDFFIEASQRRQEGKYTFKLFSDSYMEVLAGSMNTTVGLVEGEVFPENIKLSLKTSDGLNTSLTRRTGSGVLEYSGSDVLLSGTASLVDTFLYLDRTTSYAVLGVPTGRKANEKQAFALVNEAGVNLTPNSTTVKFRKFGILKYPNFRASQLHRGKSLRIFSGASDTVEISFPEDDTYYVYYDAIQDLFLPIKVSDVTDPTFEGTVLGVPLYIVTIEGGYVAKLFDVRDFHTSENAGSDITVGPTQGRYTSLKGALLRLAHCVSAGKGDLFSKNRTFRLVEDITWYMDNEGSHTFSVNAIVDGQGHTIKAESLELGLDEGGLFIVRDGANVVFKNLKTSSFPSNPSAGLPLTWFAVDSSKVDSDPTTARENPSVMTLDGVHLQGRALNISGSTTTFFDSVEILFSHVENLLGNDSSIFLKNCRIENFLVNNPFNTAIFELSNLINKRPKFHMESCQLFDSMIELKYAETYIQNVYSSNLGTGSENPSPCFRLESCLGRVSGVEADVLKDCLIVDGMWDFSIGANGNYSKFATYGSVLSLTNFTVNHHKGFDTAIGINAAIAILGGKNQLSGLNIEYLGYEPKNPNVSYDSNFSTGLAGEPVIYEEEPPVPQVQPMPFSYSTSNSRGLFVDADGTQGSDIRSLGYPAAALTDSSGKINTSAKWLTAAFCSRGISLRTNVKNCSFDHVQLEDTQVGLFMLRSAHGDSFAGDVSIRNIDAPSSIPVSLISRNVDPQYRDKLFDSDKPLNITVDDVTYSLDTSDFVPSQTLNIPLTDFRDHFNSQLTGDVFSFSLDTTYPRFVIKTETGQSTSYIRAESSYEQAPDLGRGPFFPSSNSGFYAGDMAGPINLVSNVKVVTWQGPLVSQASFSNLGGIPNPTFEVTIEGSQFLSTKTTDSVQVRVFNSNTNTFVRDQTIGAGSIVSWTDTEIVFNWTAGNAFEYPHGFIVKVNSRLVNYKFHVPTP